MRAYRAGNGRMIVRAGNGRFVRLFLGDVIPNVNAGEVTCCEFCGGDFWPILKTVTACGKCVDLDAVRPS